MAELENLLDKVEKASRTREVREALNSYCAMVRLRKRLRTKYVERVEPLYKERDNPYLEAIRNYWEDTRWELYQTIDEQAERVIELMGLSDVAKQNNLGSILYEYGRGEFSYEKLIQLLRNEVWDYFYTQKKAPVSIQALKKAPNSFVVSFDSAIKPME